MSNIFSTIPDAIKAIKQNKMLIIIDDPGRENQGDIYFPAQLADETNINFLIGKCRGLVCAPISYDYAQRLNLPLMIPPIQNSESTCINFTVSVDAIDVSDFGISASDRSKTLQVLGDNNSSAIDLVRPGHVFPLIAEDGGVLARRGHTEAAVELSKLAGFSPASVICEILDDDGKPSRLPSLKKFAKKYDLPIITIADLVDYRISQGKKIENKIIKLNRTPVATLPTEYGLFNISVITSLQDNKEHSLITHGDISHGPVLTRVHSKCFTGDTLLSKRCDCHAQLEQSLSLIQKNGSGVVVYLDQEGRGIGLADKVKAYALQEVGMNTYESNSALGHAHDLRNYEVAAQILKDSGISEIKILTNSPDKIAQLISNGIKVLERISLESTPNSTNRAYLSSKKKIKGHFLSQV